MSLDQLLIAEASPEALDAIAALCGRAFGTPDAAWFAQGMRTDPHAAEAITLMAIAEGEIASTLRIFAREIRWQARWLRLGGIGNVATAPEHRGRGLANLLMHHTIERMAQRGFEIALLFTGVPRVYEKSGFVLTAQPWFRARLDSLRGEDLADAAVRPLRDEDLPHLLPLFDAFNGGRSGPARRTEALWRWSRALNAQDDTLSLVAEHGHTPVAYARAMPGPPGTLRVHELIAEDIESAGALLHAIASHALDLGHREIVLSLPGWPLIRRTVEDVFSHQTSTLQPAAMWRSLPGGPSQDEIAALAHSGELHFWAGDRF